MRRNTKIVCTIGPATQSAEAIAGLADAGMNVVRINMSHASHEDAVRIIGWVRDLNPTLPHPLAVMLDTAGPEIRTGVRTESLMMVRGDLVDVGADERNTESAIEVDYAEIDRVLDVGDRVRLDNGLIDLVVREKHSRRLRCEVLNDGELGSRKHVNLPGVHVDLPALTKKDLDDIALGVEQRVDLIAQSFVRSSDDVDALRSVLGRGAHARIIAKIESRDGVANAESIARTADGVMVARGDLGIETDIAELPVIQRRLMGITAREGRRSIVATQMLESMIEHPIPTRAEVTDVANAIYEGADAVMLSGETSVGGYPIEATRQLANIAAVSEREVGFALEQSLVRSEIKQHVAMAAVGLAQSIDAAGIVVVTRRGIVADFVTNARPRVPIFAFTNNATTERRLALSRGVFAYRTRFRPDAERTIQAALDELVRRRDVEPGEAVIVISDVLAETPVDSIQIRYLGPSM